MLGDICIDANIPLERLCAFIVYKPPRYPFLNRLNEDEQHSTINAVHSTVARKLGSETKASNVAPSNSVLLVVPISEAYSKISPVTTLISVKNTLKRFESATNLPSHGTAERPYHILRLIYQYTLVFFLSLRFCCCGNSSNSLASFKIKKGNLSTFVFKT